MKKWFVIFVLVIATISMCSALADIPDVSNLGLDELIQLQGAVNERIAAQATYTLLPGVYDCKKDFKYNWYNCKVLPGANGEERTTTVSFRKWTPDEEAFLTYDLSSNDEGMKISLMQIDSSAGFYMVVQGAPLEAIPFSGF